MKVGVFLIQDIIPSAGGNFSYYEKLISSIDNYRFDEKIEICFVGRIPKGKIKLNRPYYQLSPATLYRIFRFLAKIKITQFLTRIFSTNSDLCNRRDTATLRDNKIDVLLFPKQFYQEIDNFPFMTMNWDAGHKSTFMFPEFAEGFEIRENWYSIQMQKALVVIVESQASKREFADYFAIPENKIEVVPLFPGGVVDLKVENELQEQILGKFNITRNSYFFYPAQFWAHKNHYNLILAFKNLIEGNRKKDLRLVLTGSDKGNKDYILSVIREQNLEKEILVLGFVSNDEIYTLYRNAIALVMPTFLGPTNMPVLEAQALKTAVLCSDLKGHRETCGDGALYADPASSAEWTIAMNDLLLDDFRSELLTKADRVTVESRFNIQQAMKSLEEILIKFIPIRRTFN